MSLPPGVERRHIDGRDRLATEGTSVYGEPTVDDWRVWDTSRSKVAAMLDRGMSIELDAEATVLYLGAGAGTTVSHLADITSTVYAVEFAPRPARTLMSVAANRPNIIPLLKDARRPETYAHVVETECSLLVQDVATVGQADVAVANRMFLADDGQLVLAIKARSEDVAADPADVFDDALETLESAYTVEEATRLEGTHDDHLAVIATPD